MKPIRTENSLYVNSSSNFNNQLQVNQGSNNINFDEPITPKSI